MAHANIEPASNKVMANSDKCSVQDSLVDDDSKDDDGSNENWDDYPKPTINMMTGRSPFLRSNSGSGNTFGSNRQPFTNSACTVAHAVFSGGGAARSPTCLLHNPFAPRHTTPSRSISETQTTDNFTGDSKPILNPPVFTPSKISSNEESGPTNFLQTSIFRPSLLSTQTEKLNINSSNDDELKNEDNSDVESKENGKSHSSQEDSSEDRHYPDTTDSNSSKPLSSTINMDNKHENLFTQFCKATRNNSLSAVSCHSEASSRTGFIFGTNMDERVVNVPLTSSNSNGCVSNGTSKFGENSTAHIISPDVEKKENCSENSSSDTSLDKSQTLEDSAREYEARKPKPIFETVTVVTGEEEESNVLQANCKLYVFDKSKESWLEKGRGLLRLNDKETQDKELQSRLVMRTQGSLRVVLNTKIWPGMSIERASEKSIRITAMDTDGLKVFLIMASPKDADQIFSAIDWRVQSLKSCEDKKSNHATKRSQHEFDDGSEPNVIKKVKFELADAVLRSKVDNVSDESRESLPLEPESDRDSRPPAGVSAQLPSVFSIFGCPTLQSQVAAKLSGSPTPVSSEFRQSNRVHELKFNLIAEKKQLEKDINRTSNTTCGKVMQSLPIFSRNLNKSVSYPQLDEELHCWFLEQRTNLLHGAKAQVLANRLAQFHYDPEQHVSTPPTLDPLLRSHLIRQSPSLVHANEELMRIHRSFLQVAEPLLSLFQDMLGIQNNDCPSIDHLRFRIAIALQQIGQTSAMLAIFRQAIFKPLVDKEFSQIFQRQPSATSLFDTDDNLIWQAFRMNGSFQKKKRKKKSVPKQPTIKPTINSVAKASPCPCKLTAPYLSELPNLQVRTTSPCTHWRR